MGEKEREDTSWGTTFPGSDATFNFIDSIDTTCSSCSAEEKARAYRRDANHEFGHQFGVNCAPEYHNLNNAWCGLCGDTSTELCVMNVTDTLQDRIDGIDRFCCYNLIQDATNCADTTECGNGIRVAQDPK